MILVCPQCATRYVVPDSSIGPTGRQVRCANCRHSWFQDGPELVRDPQPPVPAPEAVAPSVPANQPVPPVSPTPAETPPPVAVQPEPYIAPVTEVTDASGESRFAPEPPFRPRRNPAKLWTMAAVAFALVISVAGGALYYFGVPGWAVNLGLASASDQEELLLYMPKPADRRPLEDGRELFSFSARVINSSERTLPVPPLLVEMRDPQNRLVFSWVTKAEKSMLKPGEETRVTESRVNIPKNAKNLSITFVDSVP